MLTLQRALFQLVPWLTDNDIIAVASTCKLFHHDLRVHLLAHSIDAGASATPMSTNTKFLRVISTPKSKALDSFSITNLEWLAEQLQRLSNLKVFRVLPDLPLLTDTNMITLPRSLELLECPNGLLSTECIPTLPPGLKTLHINRCNPDTRWLSFCAHPQYLSSLPPSLTTIITPTSSDLFPQCLERLPPNVSRFSNASNSPNLLLRIIVDLESCYSVKQVPDILQDLFNHLRSHFHSSVSKYLTQVFLTCPQEVFAFSTGSSGVQQVLKYLNELYTLLGECQQDGSENSTVLLPGWNPMALKHIGIIAGSQNGSQYCQYFKDAFYLKLYEASEAQTAPTQSNFHGIQNRHVALGGTFDHFHRGHKILLSAGLLLSSHRIVIGISDGTLLVNKKFKEKIQPFQYRFANIQRFCTLQRPYLRIEPVKLLDAAGPTVTDPSFELLVVSQETAAGVQSINSIRASKGFQPLASWVVELASSDTSMKDLSDDVKASSTTLRIREKKLDELLFPSQI